MASLDTMGEIIGVYLSFIKLNPGNFCWITLEIFSRDSKLFFIISWVLLN